MLRFDERKCRKVDITYQNTMTRKGGGDRDTYDEQWYESFSMLFVKFRSKISFHFSLRLLDIKNAQDYFFLELEIKWIALIRDSITIQ